MAILRAVLTELPKAQDGVSLLLANETKNFSGATLRKICERAHKSAIRGLTKVSSKFGVYRFLVWSEFQLINVC